MKYQNIICFAKDWTENPTSNNHVMRLLAEENRVLWLNSIGMRKPQLTSGPDLRKILRKLVAFVKGPIPAATNLWVYTPIVLPLPHSRFATRCNRFILRWTLRRLRKELNMPTFQLWTFLPNAVEFAGSLGESLLVYYCIDEWSQFTYLDGEKMADLEEDLCRRADIVFATARQLYERRVRLNPETHFAPHGVDHAHFSQAVNLELATPPDIASLPKPIFGFFGLIHEWLDQDLLASVARAKPDWSFVLLGKALAPIDRLESLANIHLLGAKPYDELPAYCKSFAAGLIPFVVNDLTIHVNPIKLREYLSAGLPVVSTNLPEVEHYQDLCYLASGPEEFLVALDRVLKEDDLELRRRRSDRMIDETWRKRVETISKHVDRVASQKTSSA